MQPINLADYEQLARERLPQMVYDYYVGGAEDELTLRGNREAFSKVASSVFSGMVLTTSGAASSTTWSPSTNDLMSGSLPPAVSWTTASAPASHRPR